MFLHGLVKWKHLVYLCVKYEIRLSFSLSGLYEYYMYFSPELILDALVPLKAYCRMLSFEKHLLG